MLNIDSVYLKKILHVAILCSVPSLYSSYVHAEDAPKPALNATFNYLHDGQVITGWGIQLGDPSNWSTPVSADRTATSAGGKVAVEPATFKVAGDAIKITWAPRLPIKGSLAINGAAINLSKFENDGALVLDMKMDISPDKDVSIGMDCGYPCGGSVQIAKMLKKFKKDEWKTLPIPLNCFTKQGLDITKVNGPFTISTEGKLGLTITNVRLQKIPAGDTGCAG